MAELAKTYHNDIQKNGIEPDGARRRECTETVLQNIETQPTEEQTEKLRQKISGDEVEDALRYSKKDSAAGIDGLTYEFWAEIDDQYHKDSQNEDIKAFNVIKLLTAAFNDIQRFGVDPTTDFAEGWMCPIFKKKERDNIANYRPITLLNTDYKLYTKALTLKLAQAAPTLIHKTQAGFIPGRQISEQTQLTHMVMEYAAMNDPSEDEIRDGIIVALDQEKAYDKIMHDYLWKTLERFGIPEEFIKSPPVQDHKRRPTGRPAVMLTIRPGNRTARSFAASVHPDRVQDTRSN
ncbi:hypothetical protein EVJ58_g534 [Rhodofomes roseus]|uniref:Reverse transcriptase domain-containing protein n=1 Tax=Rhodofomes roseus TaxID=34475 RepID=A0A4Y9Z320_9APHY|nr:hypothetical protein EVJ58_g534 [Rhodofomes roseus]